MTIGKVTKTVSTPGAFKGRPAKYNWPDMEPGHHVTVKLDDVDAKTMNRVRNAAYFYYGKRRGMNVHVRTADDKKSLTVYII